MCLYQSYTLIQRITGLCFFLGGGSYVFSSGVTCNKELSGYKTIKSGENPTPTFFFFLLSLGFSLFAALYSIGYLIAFTQESRVVLKVWLLFSFQYSRARCFMFQFSVSHVHFVGELFSVGHNKVLPGCLSVLTDTTLVLRRAQRLY